jgi:hypothetical protein
MTTEAEKFTVIWQTAAAFIIAAITCFIGMFLAGLFITLSQTLLTTTRPEIIGFFASIGAGAAGVFVAREVCDRLFKHYSQRTIFGLFLAYVILGTLVEIFIVPAHWGQISVYAQNVAILLVAYSLFWKGDAAGFSN